MVMLIVVKSRRLEMSKRRAANARRKLDQGRLNKITFRESQAVGKFLCSMETLDALKWIRDSRWRLATKLSGLIYIRGRGPRHIPPKSKFLNA